MTEVYGWIPMIWASSFMGLQMSDQCWINNGHKWSLTFITVLGFISIEGHYNKTLYYNISSAYVVELNVIRKKRRLVITILKSYSPKAM